MPQTGLKQKTRTTVKTKTKSAFEHMQRHKEDDDVDMESGMSQGEEEEEEEDVPEKDDAEKKLEKLLFGDDEGFHEALKDQRSRGMMDLVFQSDEESDREDNEERGEGDERALEDVPDADVRVSFLSATLVATE